MKAALNTLSLLLAAGYLAAETAEAAGVRLPAVVTAENAVMALTAVLAVALAIGDYGRKIRLPGYTARPAKLRLKVAGVRRNGYAIRRGAEAARLATPAPVNVFRKHTLHYERAA